MAECETVWVKTKGADGKEVECWVNASDFDAKVHQKAAEPKAKKPKAK